MNKYRIRRIFVTVIVFACVKECRAYEVCEYYRFSYTYCEDGYYCCGKNAYGEDLCCEYYHENESSRSENSSSRLTDGAISGIVIGSFLFVCCIVLAVYCFTKKKNGQIGRVIHVQQPDGDGVAYISNEYYPQQNYPQHFYPQQQKKQPVHGAVSGNVYPFAPHA